MDRRVRNPLVAMALGLLALCLGLAFEAGRGPSAEPSASPAPVSTGSAAVSERETTLETAARTAPEPDTFDSAEIPEAEVPEGAPAPEPAAVALSGRFVRPDGEDVKAARRSRCAESASGFV